MARRMFKRFNFCLKCKEANTSISGGLNIDIFYIQVFGVKIN